MTDGEIVGLHKSTNGRTCVQHPCCGQYVAAGDLVHLKRDVVFVCPEEPNQDAPQADALVETVVKAVLVRDGTEMCTIGFLRRSIAVRPAAVERCTDHRAFYDLCDQGSYKKTKSLQNSSIASFHLLDDIHEGE